MKLSFSTNRWKGISFRDFIDYAVKYRFSGIEIHDISALENQEPDFSRIYHRLVDKKLCVPCIDTVNSVTENNGNEVFECIHAATALRCPYVRIKADKSEKSLEIIKRLIATVKPLDIVLLVETVGDFADTKALLSLLRRIFKRQSCSSLGSLLHLSCRRNSRGKS
jgi:sugar phosphate isomerase/epimerase